MEIIERILAVIGLLTTVGILISAYFIKENLK
jgi:hypothetical protein